MKAKKSLTCVTAFLYHSICLCISNVRLRNTSSYYSYNSDGWLFQSRHRTAVLQKRTLHKKRSAVRCAAQATSILGVKYKNPNEGKKIVTSEKCKSIWFSKYENIMNNLALGTKIQAQVLYPSLGT